VLLTTEMGSGKEVLNALNKIIGVKEVHQIHGVYDFIIRVEAETPQKLKNLVNRVRDIREMRSTLQLICMR